MKNDTWTKLEAEFAEFPNLKGEAVSEAELAELEARLGFPLPSDYREFIARCGGAIVGAYRIYGLRRAAAMGRKEGFAMETTDHYRKQAWPGTESWLVFSVDQSGNPIGLDEKGHVWISDHDFGGVARIADSFEEFIIVTCLKR